MSERTPQAERDALEQLLASEGWAIVKEMVQAAHGPEAFERAFDDALRGVKPSEVLDFERAVTPQIRAAFQAARGVIAMVESRVAALKDAERSPKAAGRFGAFRRGPVTA